MVARNRLNVTWTKKRILTNFMPDISIPLEHIENRNFDVFREYRKRPVARSRLIIVARNLKPMFYKAQSAFTFSKLTIKH